MKTNHKEIECYFSRITEHRDTLEMDYKRIRDSSSFTDTEDEDPKFSMKNVESNTKVKVARDGKTLEFTTKGGMTMEVNTEIKINRLFRLKEGIMIEFVAQERYDISQIYDKIRKGGMQVEHTHSADYSKGKISTPQKMRLLDGWRGFCTEEAPSEALRVYGSAF